jgi:hypothetical protein
MAKTVLITGASSGLLGPLEGASRDDLRVRSTRTSWALLE